MKLSKENYYELYNKYEKPPSTIFHKYISKKLAKFFTFYFLRFNFTPNTLSILTTFFVLVGASSLNLMSNITGQIIFLVCLQFSYVIDCSDGVVARISKKSASFGAYLDITLDRINIFLVYLGLGVYLNSVHPFTEYTALLYVFSAIFNFHYQLMALLRKHYFPSLDGFMKSKKSKSLIRIIVKFIYEFIDTGIFFFILALSVFLDIILEVVVFYGLIGLALSLAMYVFLYNVNSDESRKK